MAEDFKKMINDHMEKMFSISRGIKFYSDAYLERDAELERYNEILHGPHGVGNIPANLNAIHKLVIFKKKHDLDQDFVCDQDCRNYPRSCDICKRNSKYSDMLAMNDRKE